MRALVPAGVVVSLALFAVACGGSKKAATPPQPTQSATSMRAAPVATAASSPSPLQAEAKAAATGDIPDNQVFLRLANTAAGYSMRYPEGWAQQGSGSTVTIRDKNNIVRLVVTPGGAVTPAAARSDLRGVAGATIASAPQSMTVSHNRAVKVVYTTQSSANAVTGKRLTLVVDRYYLWHGGKRAVVDLGTPQGVDNVDAYRLMIESFTWK
jgi:hypothetical protein